MLTCRVALLALMAVLPARPAPTFEGRNQRSHLSRP